VPLVTINPVPKSLPAPRMLSDQAMEVVIPDLHHRSHRASRPMRRPRVASSAKTAHASSGKSTQSLRYLALAAGVVGGALTLYLLGSLEILLSG
jgi:hypothetical protein